MLSPLLCLKSVRRNRNRNQMCNANPHAGDAALELRRMAELAGIVRGIGIVTVPGHAATKHTTGE
jgi:hypothetical protein